MIFTFDCPHCRTKKSVFQIFGAEALSRNSSCVLLAGQCNTCDNGVFLELNSSWGAINAEGFLQGLKHIRLGGSDDIQIKKIYPKPEMAEAPQHTPEEIAEEFIEALEVLKSGHFNAAGMAFRRTLDIATKAISKPKLKKMSLFDRINTLAAENKITNAMRYLAHKVRLDGNEANHSEKRYSEAEAKALHRLTTIFLTYLFEIPGLIETAESDIDEEKKSSTKKE